jgi:hypothetical protein
LFKFAQDVVHIGIVYSAEIVGNTVKLITADAGQGPANDQKHAWVFKSYDITSFELVGPNGEGADGKSSKPVRYIKGWMDIDVMFGNMCSTDPVKYKDAWKLQFENPKNQKLMYDSDTILPDDPNFIARRV